MADYDKCGFAWQHRPFGYGSPDLGERVCILPHAHFGDCIADDGSRLARSYAERAPQLVNATDSGEAS
jgi:hypothetical protein